MTRSTRRRARAEQTRARYPDEEGYVERDGVRVFYEVYGRGEPTVFLLPTWSIIHSRHWKMQIPYLARHFRVADLRRPRKREGRTARAGSRPTPSGSSPRTRSRSWTRPARSRRSSSGSPAGPSGERCSPPNTRSGSPGAVFIGPAVPLAPGHSERNVHSFQERARHRRRLGEVQPPLLDRATIEEFLEYFFSQIFTEPHSTKQIEDCVGWGLEIAPETLDRQLARRSTCAASRAPRHLRPGALPGARAARERGRDPSARPGRRARGGHRRHPRHARGLGPLDRTPATP